jgi:hypothetical protein
MIIYLHSYEFLRALTRLGWRSSLAPIRFDMDLPMESNGIECNGMEWNGMEWNWRCMNLLRPMMSVRLINFCVVEILVDK